MRTIMATHPFIRYVDAENLLNIKTIKDREEVCSNEIEYKGNSYVSLYTIEVGENLIFDLFTHKITIKNEGRLRIVKTNSKIYFLLNHCHGDALTPEEKEEERKIEIMLLKSISKKKKVIVEKTIVSYNNPFEKYGVPK